MSGKVFYIPTLQDYAKKRKRLLAEVFEPKNCLECDYCRETINACIWGDNVRDISLIASCPINNRSL